MELGHSIRAGTPAFEHVHGMQLFEYLDSPFVHVMEAVRIK